MHIYFAYFSIIVNICTIPSKIRTISTASELRDLSDTTAIYASFDEVSHEGFSSERLTDFITSSLKEKKDNDVVKVLAAAMQIASENGTLQIPSSNPLQTAITAVNTTKQLNLAYLVEQGEIKAHQVAEDLINQATVNASVFVETAFSKPVLEKGMNAVLDFASNIYPPFKPATEWAKQFTPPIASFVSEKIRPKVKEAVQHVSSWARQAVHRCISSASSRVTTVVKNIGKRLASFFS